LTEQEREEIAEAVATGVVRGLLRQQEPIRASFGFWNAIGAIVLWGVVLYCGFIVLALMLMPR
jgi:hypothetical protein